MNSRIRSLTLQAGIADRLRAAFSNATARRGVISIVNQAIVSGTNFLTTIILGHACLPAELGLYSIGFSLTVVLMGLPRALIWTPYTTFRPTLSDDDRRAYAGSALVHQLALCVLLGLLVSSAGLLAPMTGIAGLSSMLLVLGPALALMCLREHIRRIYFSHLEASKAVLVDATVAALQLGGIAALARWSSLSAVKAYCVIIAAYLPVVVAWFVVSRSTMAMSGNRIIDDMAKNWKYGRWIFATALIYAVDDALYPWALSWMHGTTAVGMLSAASGVIFLMNPLVLAFWNFFGPQSAHLFSSDGIGALYRLVIRSGAALAFTVALFTVAVGIWGGQLVVLLFGEKFHGQGDVVTAAALGQLGFVITIPFTLGLMAVGRSDLLLRTVILRLALSATVGIWCIHKWGAVGVGYSQFAINAVWGICQWWILKSLVDGPAEATV